MRRDCLKQRAGDSSSTSYEHMPFMRSILCFSIDLLSINNPLSSLFELDVFRSLNIIQKSRQQVFDHCLNTRRLRTLTQKHRSLRMSPLGPDFDLMKSRTTSALCSKRSKGSTSLNCYLTKQRMFLFNQWTSLPRTIISAVI